MGNVVRTVSVRLTAEANRYMSEMTKAKGVTKDFMGQVDELAKTSPEKFNQLAMAAAATGVAMLAVAGTAVKASMEFDKRMSAVSAVADASIADMGRLRQAALDAGAGTKFSAAEAARAEEELAKAGIKVSEILGGALKGALDLAAAGEMGLADAAVIAAQAMNIFGLKGAAVPHIADVLASAANKSAADMKGLGDALAQGGLVANAAGLSLEETTGVLAAFADRALVGSDAGTSLKTMLQMLAAPSEKTADLMKSLGVNVYDAGGKFIGVTKLAGLLQNKLGGLTQAERDYAMAQIFGSDATRAANILFGLGEKGLQGYIDAVQDAGAASDTAAKKTDNLAGDVERLTGSLETLAIESGSGVNSGLRVLTQALNGVVDGISALPTWLQSAGVGLIALGGASLLGAAGLLKARATMAETIETLNGMGTGGEKAAKGIGYATKSLGYLTAAVAAVAITFEVWHLLEKIQGMDAESISASGSVDDFTNSLVALAKTGKATGKLADAFGTDLAGIQKEFDEVKAVTDELAAYEKRSWIGQNADYKSFLEHKQAYLKEHMDKVDAGLAALVNGGNVAAASLALRNLAEQSGVPLEVLMAKLPLYSAAAAGAATANQGLAKGFASAGSQAAILKASMDEAVASGLTLTDVWNTLHGATLGADKAMLNANQAVEAIGKSFKENGKAIDGNSTAALKNRITIEEAAKAAAEAAQKTYEKSSATKDETSALRDAETVYKGYLKKLHDALIATGLSEGKVRDLIAAYADMPPTKTTTVNTPGIDAAIAKAKRLVDLQRKMGVSVNAYDPEGLVRNRHGGVYEKAAAGTLRQASIYSAMNPGRYMIAEPETGGEAFVPKRGDYGRSMSILSQAARWYGAAVVPTRSSAHAGSAPRWQSSPGSTTQTIIHEHRHILTLNGTSVLSGLRDVIELKGGDPVKVLGSRR